MLSFKSDERSVTALNGMFDDSSNNHDKQMFVPFRDFDYGKDSAFIICHGTSRGTIVIGTHSHYREYTSIELLSKLYSYLQSDNIKTLYVICCYAGLLPEETIDGVTIKGVCLDKTPISIDYNSIIKQQVATIHCCNPQQELVA